MLKQTILAVSLLFSWNVIAKEQTIFVDGMDCGHCIEKIEASLRKSSDVQGVDVNLETGKVVIKTKEKKELSAELIERLIKDAGFSVRKEVKKGA